MPLDGGGRPLCCRDNVCEAGNGDAAHQTPARNATDAIQSYNPETDTALAVITRAQSDGPEYQFHPRGLDSNRRYTVWFDIDPAVYSMSGSQLMSNGVRVKLPTPYSSDVVHVEAQ